MKKDKIISGIIRMFMKSGIKTVTMDSIAKELGISKKTIYKYFTSRTEMISEIVKSFIQSDMKARNELTRTAKNSIDEMVSMGSYNSKLFDILSPKTVTDLKQYYPKIWKEIFDFQKVFMKKQVLDNLKKGLSEGFYRKDINPELVARIYVLLGLAIIEDNELESKPETLKPLFAESLKYHLSGILSEAGRNEAKKYM